MKLTLLQLGSSFKGPARRMLLERKAAASLSIVEKETGGLIYIDMWRDGVGSLLAKRNRKPTPLPGYSAHNYGLAVDLDVPAILQEKKIRYEDLLYFMKKRGWYCHRRDGDESLPESEHFNYLGDTYNKYLIKTTMDPATWQNAVEEKIYEKYGQEFQLDIEACQKALSKLGMYSGPESGKMDNYTRESILAFQRAWDLVEDGYAGKTLCRVLSFITAEVEYVSS